IEHLAPEVFPSFASVLLGVYRPRLFLITTPSYTFNARFSPPAGSEGYTGEERPGTWQDPTNRTSRWFRHPDHKFEWTIEEFHDYCTSVGNRFGYTVVIGGVGRSVEPDPWGRDKALGFASQTALFRRINPTEQMSNVPDAMSRCSHKLRATHVHGAHPRAGYPLPLARIATVVRDAMESVEEDSMRIDELWRFRRVSLACGGWVEMLLAAV
ncbi:hypothetical protein PUNSTDRAFT_25427, partial [Punctularia strigosozonata HHB-11173 SS5]